MVEYEDSLFAKNLGPEKKLGPEKNLFPEENLVPEITNNIYPWLTQCSHGQHKPFYTWEGKYGADGIKGWVQEKDSINKIRGDNICQNISAILF